MGKQYTAISDHHRAFIEDQRIFFIATAAPGAHINLSPKGMDSLRVLAPDRVLWGNLTGSGNETAAHLREDPRITLMFCAFEGNPLILRLYGEARAIHPRDADWPVLVSKLPELPGLRQLIDIHVRLVQTSCGFGVPLFEYQGERDDLRKWTERKGEAGLEAYQRTNNRLSLNGRNTGLFDDEDSGPQAG